MEIKNFNQKDIIFSLDIGTRSIIGTVGIVQDKKFNVISEKYLEHEERAMVDGQIHDINLVSLTVSRVKKALEDEMGFKLSEVSIAAAGRLLKTITIKTDLEIDSDTEIDKELIRSLNLSAVKKAEEEIKSSTEGKLYCVGYSVKAYYLNGYVISNLLGHKGDNISAEVIATFLPRSVVDSLYSVMNKVNLKVVSLTLEPIAAMEATIPKKLRLLNLALVDIGAGTSDVAISSDQTISAYGMVPLAGDEITEKIVTEYLVDFNEAEDIKRKLLDNDEVTFTDVVGIENTIKSDEILKVIDSTISKIAEEVSKKIIELNGDKSPSAVFLVGGGAHTPFISKKIAQNLNIPETRVAIKDRNSINDCISNNNLGSSGVTVLGIALVAIRNSGTDFIDVVLNDEPISLFNSHKHTVMDALIQAGVNPSLMIAKTGKAVRFTYNGNKRIVFGNLGKNAEIKINGEKANIESEIIENDNIDVMFAKDGDNAHPKISEYINSINSISVYIDNNIVNLDPIIIVNEDRKDINYIIENGDNIKIFIPKSISYIKKYVLKTDDDLFINDNKADESYIVTEGEKIFTKKKIESLNTQSEDYIEESAVEIGDIKKLDKKEDLISKGKSLHVTVNDEEVTLTGKDEYVVVDVFNFYDFDLTIPKGIIHITVNGADVQYTYSLKENDVIKIFWQNIK
ncbi:cell division FtsA domain-containing protein [Clostridium sp. BJN0001]|uniref:cell division protein FtsA n=1 Tax=Clostridium sp. BJN0001 TaxID=2930219 RepID=UPI001FD20B42|nr:cell division FtsA domain-containing protein [Clostridium sp. BJN0001]